MSSDHHTRQREEMVTVQLERRGLQNALVLAAMRKVPRHLFVPEAIADAAYQDRPLPIGHGQTISQPYVVALMTDFLDLKTSSKVLEVGTGSGYQAAVLGEIAQEVYTIEIVAPLAAQATARLEAMKYTNVHVRSGDGYLGWEEHAPFDAIIVTCAPEAVPQPLVDQLKPNGRLVIPVGPNWGSQSLYLMVKQHDGELATREVIPVRFVPMTGPNVNPTLPQ